MKGEVTSSDLLKEFYKNLYTGSVSITEVTSKNIQLIDSSCTDAIYDCSGSKVLPVKHSSLALAVKSLTITLRLRCSTDLDIAQAMKQYVELIWHLRRLSTEVTMTLFQKGL